MSLAAADPWVRVIIVLPSGLLRDLDEVVRVLDSGDGPRWSRSAAIRAAIRAWIDSDPASTNPAT